MRISKTLAEQVAKKLLEKKKESYTKCHSILLLHSEKLALDYMDQDLLESFERYKEYYKQSRYLNFFSYVNDTRVEVDVTCDKYFPSNNSSSRIYIEISADEIKALEKIKNEIDLIKSDYNKALSIVTETIFGLKTALQVKKHFPEAFEHLPKETNGTMLPMVNLDQVRALVQTN